MLGIALNIWRVALSAVDRTPGGIANAYLLEDGVSGFQLEDASGVLLME